MLCFEQADEFQYSVDYDYEAGLVLFVFWY